MTVASSDWSAIHPECGGQVRALPNAVENEEYECLACGLSLERQSVLVFNLSDEKEKLPSGTYPSDVLSLSRDERKTLDVEDDDERVREKLVTLLEEKSIF